MSLKKAVAKKTVAKKAAKKVVKKVVAKKVAAKKAPAKKAAVKTIIKKAPAKKTVVKKVAAKKVVTKKTVVKKTVAKKAVAKKIVAKKVAVKKVTAKKVVVKKLAAKKTVVKKVIAKKASPKKAPVKKTVIKNTAPVKVAVAKTAPVKSVVKIEPKKTVTEKVAPNNFRNKLVTESNHNEVPVAKKPVETRVTKRTLTQTDALLESVISGLEEKKAKNISLLDLRDLENRVSDYFVIAEGDSNTHVDAISGSVEEMVKKISNERPYRMEGVENSEWIIIDYVNIVVHIFQREARAYYKLEELWADAKIQHISN
jgi:ribosome silencing factor RsfS/YbeB/iojap